MTTMTDGPVYKVLGTTDDVTECGICGKVELKGTMALDVDGETVYAGFTCGARLVGKPVRELRTAAARADREAAAAKRAAEQAESDRRHAEEQAAFAAWVLDRYGVTISCTADLWGRKAITGKTPFAVFCEWKGQA